MKNTSSKNFDDNHPEKFVPRIKIDKTLRVFPINFLPGGLNHRPRAIQNSWLWIGAPQCGFWLAALASAALLGLPYTFCRIRGHRNRWSASPRSVPHPELLQVGPAARRNARAPPPLAIVLVWPEREFASCSPSGVTYIWPWRWCLRRSIVRAITGEVTSEQEGWVQWCGARWQMFFPRRSCACCMSFTFFTLCVCMFFCYYKMCTIFCVLTNRGIRSTCWGSEIGLLQFTSWHYGYSSVTAKVIILFILILCFIIFGKLFINDSFDLFGAYL